MTKSSKRKSKGAFERFGAQFRKRPKPVWVLVTADVLLFGAALLVFALFHHVLPRRESAVGLASSRESVGSVLLDAVVDDSEEEYGDPVFEALDGMEDDAFMSDGTEADDSAEAPVAEAPEADAPVIGEDEGEALEPAGGEAVAAPAILGYFGDSFPGKFTTGEVIKSKSGYQSENVNITLKRYNSNSQRFYVADIYIRDISCFVTAFAKDTFGRGFREAPSTINSRIGGLIAVNGDYYGARSDGNVIRNGVLYRADEHPVRDVCVLYWDGRMETYGAGTFDPSAAIRDGAYQAWNFGPMLLDENGLAMTTFNSDLTPNNPRTAIGYYEPGHYCFVVVDGRQGNYRGMTLKRLSALMEELGCVRAYNMDGGDTSTMVAGNRVVNKPSDGGRKSSDIIAIIDP